MPLSQAQLAPSDPVLTEHAQRYAPLGHIADLIAPPLTGKAEKGQIEIWDKMNMQIPDDSERAIGMEASEARSPEPSYVDYTALAHSRRILVTQREMDIRSAGGGDPSMIEFSRTNAIIDQLLLEKENTVATKLTTAANYESGFSAAIASGSEWDTANGDPISNIFAGINACEDASVVANTFATDLKVWRALQRHSDLLDIFKYTRGGRITEADFMNFFGMRVMIGADRYWTGAAWSTIWGDNAIVCHVPNVSGDVMPPESDVAFCRHVESDPLRVKTYPAEEKGFKGAWWIEAEHTYTPEFFAIDNTTDLDSVGGYLMTNCLA